MLEQRLIRLQTGGNRRQQENHLLTIGELRREEQLVRKETGSRAEHRIQCSSRDNALAACPLHQQGDGTKEGRPCRLAQQRDREPEFSCVTYGCLLSVVRNPAQHLESELVLATMRSTATR
jgi:hypothetical protein